MSEYQIHKVQRVKDLTDSQYEVVTERKMLKFTPGDRVRVYNYDGPPIFIASGIQEPWLRFIVDKKDHPELTVGKKIKLYREVETEIDGLMGANNPYFIISPSGVGPVLSYFSTFLHKCKECNVCLIGEECANKNWFEEFTNFTTEVPEDCELEDRDVFFINYEGK
jgi:hypothetical protein